MNHLKFSIDRKIDDHTPARRQASKLGSNGSAAYRRSILISFVGLFLAIASYSFGINASPDWIDLQQRDGTKIRLRVRGDERLHWFEDERGFTVICDAGRYVYANRDSHGRVVATTLLVGKVDPQVAGIPKGLPISAHVP
jgi:hypothetical protein